jgi:ATP-dependent DNA helicase PIF1
MLCKQNFEYAAMLREASLIIWNEVPKQHLYCSKAIDQTLQDICDSIFFFKGVTIVFGGDFRQILPIIPRDARPQIIGACLCRSPIWQHVTLSINMRLQNESLENREFA